MPPRPGNTGRRQSPQTGGWGGSAPVNPPTNAPRQAPGGFAGPFGPPPNTPRQAPGGFGTVGPSNPPGYGPMGGQLPVSQPGGYDMASLMGGGQPLPQNPYPTKMGAPTGYGATGSVFGQQPLSESRMSEMPVPIQAPLMKQMGRVGGGSTIPPVTTPPTAPPVVPQVKPKNPPQITPPATQPPGTTLIGNEPPGLPPTKPAVIPQNPAPRNPMGRVAPPAPPAPRQPLGRVEPTYPGEGTPLQPFSGQTSEGTFTAPSTQTLPAQPQGNFNAETIWGRAFGSPKAMVNPGNAPQGAGSFPGEGTPLRPFSGQTDSVSVDRNSLTPPGTGVMKPTIGVGGDYAPPVSYGGFSGYGDRGQQPQLPNRPGPGSVLPGNPIRPVNRGSGAGK